MLYINDALWDQGSSRKEVLWTSLSNVIFVKKQQFVYIGGFHFAIGRESEFVGYQ